MTNKTSIKWILEQFAADGVDDLEIKKESDLITIGYFHDHPVDCVKISDNNIIFIVFSQQPKLDWLFQLQDSSIFIEDDYFIDHKEK